MTSRQGRTALAACALLGVGTFASCGETRGVILGEAAAPAPDAAALAADAGTNTESDCGTCVVPIALDGTTSTVQQGGATGTAYTDLCPGNQAIVGFTGDLTAPSVGLVLVGAIQAICGALSLADSWLTAAPGATLPLRGTAQSSPWTQTCPPNEVVVGFVGRSGSDLDAIALACAPWSTGGTNADGGLAIGATTTLDPTGGDGGTPYQVTCPAGQLARGTNLRAGEWVDAFGLVCGSPALDLDAGP